MKRLLPFLLWCGAAFGQVPAMPLAVPLPYPKVQFFDVNGNPLAGGLVYTYAAGTTTPLATYTDSTAGTENSNPVVLDSGGFANIWIQGQAYKIVVQNSAAVQQWVVDNVTDTTFFYIQHLKYASDSSVLSFRLPGAPTGSIVETVQAKLGQTISVQDFGASGGSHDDTADIQAAVNYACTQGWSDGGRPDVYFPPTSNGIYNVSSTITIGCDGIRLYSAKFQKLLFTGTGDLFQVVPAGYGVEFDGFFFVGLGSPAQVAIEFAGSGGTSVDLATVHDCWFQGFGNPALSNYTAGGNILVSGIAVGLKVDHNLFSQGGYSVRSTTGTDNLIVTNNVSNISAAFFVELVQTGGTASNEVSHNDVANVGGLIYTFNAGSVVVENNEYVPGEVGSLGNMVQYDDSGSLIPNSAGFSAGFRFISTFSLSVRSNVCSILGGALPTGQYCYYLADTQNPAEIEDNKASGYSVHGIRTGAQYSSFTRNSDVGSDPSLYDQDRPGIVHFGSPSTSDWSFGTADQVAPFNLALAEVTPVSGGGMFRITSLSNKLDWITLGYSQSIGSGYFDCYAAGAYAPCTTHGPWVVDGITDTSSQIILGSGQGSEPFRITKNDGVTDLLALNPLGTTLTLENSTNPAFVATDATGVSGIFSASSGGGAVYVGALSNHPTVIYANSLVQAEFTPLTAPSFSYGGSANAGVCWKTDHVHIGYCSTVLSSGGTCTCN